MITLQKPARGTALRERKDRRADRRAAEQRALQAALKRDGRRCRWPGCTGQYRGLTLPVDPAHLVHRGMGGNAALDRTTRGGILALCRHHHGALDAGLLEIQATTDAGTDGPLAFFEKRLETCVMAHVATETRIGVSAART